MKAKLTTLDNGLRIITVPMKDNPTVTVLALVAAGSKYETKANSGISHFLEHMCFKGTETRLNMDIVRELDGLGAQSNAFTWQEFTGYYAKARSSDFHQVIDVISDIYLNSTLPEKELDKERGVIIGEIDMYEDIPMRKIYDYFLELLYGDQPAGWDVLGPKKNIRNLTREDFVKYREEHYVAQGTVIVVAGGVSHREALRTAKKSFAEISTKRKHTKKKVVETQKKPAIKLAYRKTDQTHLMMGVRAFAMSHKDVPALTVLTTILGKGMSSRLFEKLREEMGVGYYVRADMSLSTDHGVLEISAGVDTDRVHEVIEAIMSELQKLQTELVGTKELQKAKDLLAGHTLLNLESSDNVADYYGMKSILGMPLTTPKERIKVLQKITAEDVRRVARKIFKSKNLNLVLLGPHKQAAVFKKLLTFDK